MTEDQNIQKETQTEKRTGHENLVPLNKRSPEEVKRITSAGGKKSGESRRFSKDMRDSIKRILELQATKDKQREVLGDDSSILNGYSITMADLINLKLLQEAQNGSSKAWELLRDTAGFKPVDQVQTDLNIMTDNDRALLDKLAKRNGIKAPED